VPPGSAAGLDLDSDAQLVVEGIDLERDFRDSVLGELCRPARQRTLRAVGLAESNREPLAVFTRIFVAALTGRTLASSRAG
jgi:hypothetical protein